MSRESYDAIVREAQRYELGYGGHVSRHVGIQHALASRQGFIEHLSGYEVYLNPEGRSGAFAWRNVNESLVSELIDLTLEAGTWNCPTLAIFSMISANDPVVRQNRQAFVKALFDAGAPLLIGTDSGIGQTRPGRSLVDEMAEFVEAGLTPADVLRLTTLEAARFLKAEADFGQIAVGLRADLLLVEGNPLESLAPLRQPSAVFVRGRQVR